MSDQNDDSQNYALMVLAGLVALVIAGVLALAIHTGSGMGPPKTPTASNAAATRLVVGEPEGRIYFELGSDALPAEASDILVKLADSARAQSGKVILISGFHDASGDAATNAELAKKRAQAVRHALEANGVAPDRLVLDKPMVTTGGADAREARRVELRLR
jgi:outer membrane protein OmpA-like peptidoglycan-associated protein